MKVEGVDTLETVKVWHVNAATEPSWRSSIGDEMFIDHPTPEAAFGAAMAWARTSPERKGQGR